MAKNCTFLFAELPEGTIDDLLPMPGWLVGIHADGTLSVFRHFGEAEEDILATVTVIRTEVGFKYSYSIASCRDGSDKIIRAAHRVHDLPSFKDAMDAALADVERVKALPVPQTEIEWAWVEAEALERIRPAMERSLLFWSATDRFERELEIFRSLYGYLPREFDTAA